MRNQLRNAMLPFLLIASLGLLVPSAAQESVTKVAVLQNGGFENGLSGWGTIESGIGQSSASKLIAHSGSSSLLLDLRPTSGVFTNEIQGVSESTSVKNLRDLEVVAWAFTPTCSLPEGVVGRLRIQVGQFTLRYEIHGTCGSWRPISPNLKQDLETTFGAAASQLFQQNGEVPIVIALELIRATANAMALAEYVSVNWDDVEMIASIPVETTIATAVANTSITSTSVEETTPTTPQITQAVTEQTTTYTHILTQTQYLLGSPEQFYATLAVIFAAAFGFSMAFYVRSKLRKWRTPPPSKEKMEPSSREFCRECGARIPKYSGTKFCQECGSEIG